MVLFLSELNIIKGLHLNNGVLFANPKKPFAYEKLTLLQI